MNKQMSSPSSLVKLGRQRKKIQQCLLHKQGTRKGKPSCLKEDVSSEVSEVGGR